MGASATGKETSRVAGHEDGGGIVTRDSTARTRSSVALPPMSLLFALAETTDATDYDETLLVFVIGITVIALGYAAIAAWLVTPASDHD